MLQGIEIYGITRSNKSLEEFCISFSKTTTTILLRHFFLYPLVQQTIRRKDTKKSHH